MTYTLKVTETKNKAGKYLYEVINDETGEIVSTRRSNRQYVACTIHGEFYFGRLDLIGKGDHGRQVKGINERGKFKGYRTNEQGNAEAIFDANDKTQIPIAYKK